MCSPLFFLYSAVAWGYSSRGSQDRQTSARASVPYTRWEAMAERPRKKKNEKKKKEIKKNKMEKW